MEGNRFRDSVRIGIWICALAMVVIAPILEDQFAPSFRIAARNWLLITAGLLLAMSAESDIRNRHDLYDHHRPAVEKATRK